MGEYLGYLAEGYAGLGDVEKASSAIKNAFGATPEEKVSLPKLHYTHADILWKQPNADLKLVEASYRQAIDVSRQFGSLARELQAVTRLGQLLQSCGRGAEALALLTPLYAKFTEGFDTKTLHDAKELMRGLS